MILDEDGEPLTRALFSPAELACMDAIDAITRSLIRQRAVDAELAEEFRQRAKAAVAAGGDTEAVMQRWLPLHCWMETCTDPAAWAMRNSVK